MAPGNVNINPSGSSLIEHVEVAGAIKMKILILYIIAGVLTLMVLGGVIGLMIQPKIFQSFWNSVLPVISGVMFGLIGFVVGKKVGPDK